MKLPYEVQKKVQTREEKFTIKLFQYRLSVRKSENPLLKVRFQVLFDLRCKAFITLVIKALISSQEMFCRMRLAEISLHKCVCRI